MDIDWEKPEDVMEVLVQLYGFQTSDEQMTRATAYDNSVGFNAVDAPILSSFAEQILNHKRALSEKQLELCRALLPKYAKQIGALQRSNMPLPVAQVHFIPPPKPQTNGNLILEGKFLVFIPNVYPSVAVKKLGFTWSSPHKGWKCLANVPAAEGVKRLFSPIDVAPEVEEFIAGETKAPELSSTVHKSTLFEMQKKAVAFMVGRKRVLLGMRPGTGKTATSIFAANELKDCDDILVVCPLSLVRNWKKEIKKWIGEDAVIWHGSPTGWEPYNKWVITNYDTFIRHPESFKVQDFTAVIFDESILMKNRKTRRSEAAKDFCRSKKYVWLLSGNPVAKFLDDAWSQLSVVDPVRFRSYWNFVDRYCVKETNRWGTSVVDNQEDGLERLRADISDIYFTCTLEDIVDVPDWVFDTYPIPMSETQFRYYYQMEQEFLAELPEGDVLLAPNTLSQMTRLIQFASNPLLLGGEDDGCKWKAIEELMQTEEFPMIIWTTFIQTANFVSTKLGSKYRVARLTGQTDDALRQDVVERFQDGKIDVIVAHPAVGKFGHTLTRARTSIYMERSFNSDDYYQSLFRVRRIGTDHSPHVINLVATRARGFGNTIDEVIDAVLDFRVKQGLSMTSSTVQEVKLTSGLIRGMLGKEVKEITYG